MNPEATGRIAARTVQAALAALVRNDPLRSAAALSFYALFSLAPLVIVVLAIAGMLVSDPTLQTVLINRVARLTNPQTASLVATIIEQQASRAGSSLPVIVAGLITAVGATTAFAELHYALNRIWRVDSGRGLFWQIAKGRLVSLAFLLTLAALLAVSLTVSTTLAAIGDLVTARFPGTQPYRVMLGFATSFGVTTVLITLIYRFVPDTDVRWREALGGALVAGLLFESSDLLIRLYVAKLGVVSAYGAAGSVVVFMLWTWVAALIVLIGAEVSHALAGQRPTADTGLSD